MTPIRKLLVANRSEIAIRVFRSAHELGVRTVAIYSHEDRYALHRFKADEAYQVGEPGEPIRAYLDIPRIVALARNHGVDAIHPGYGFLSENADFAEACAAGGIAFVGPPGRILRQLGDKVSARKIAQEAGVPVLGGTARALESVEEGLAAAQEQGFPVILKAAHGGGGRGMRVVRDAAAFPDAFEAARRESLSAFGSDEVFIERFIERARHIEVQLLGDQHGNLVHLFERDCSVQRRHQKVCEIAPAPNLPAEVRDRICDAALAIGRSVAYPNAGTVEFLLDVDSGNFFFIEVNPRIQVEHTVTEEATGLDIVKRQILIAQGTPLDDPEIGLATQEDVRLEGFAIQCRVTTEDPANNFTPDYGRVAHYRSASGMGIRLDAGSAFSGAVVNPYYDSMLVKVTARGRRFRDAALRMDRCLHEFRIRGVKTNIPFLIKLVNHPAFLAGECTTRFIDETPELFQLPPRRDRATRLLQFLGDVIVNGNALVKDLPAAPRREPAHRPRIDVETPTPSGTRDMLLRLGPEKFAQWVLEQRPLLWTDTTFRDAHQSLLATRLRTYDLLQIAPYYARMAEDLFSIEMWGGATFDTSYRFLKESPWERLASLREAIPNIPFQMLLRASNAVGYTNYPDNVVQSFVHEAAAEGIDVFRVFDALNWTENMQVAMEAVLATGKVCEAAICYTGDILNPARSKYSLGYYVDLAKALEKMGAHILAIKDMAGLCKPEAARVLVRTLKQEIGLPIHFHTHDTAGLQAGAILNAAEVGLDIADGAMAPLSGGTSQPNLNTAIEALRFSGRQSTLDGDKLDQLADYWREVREFYGPFEADVRPAAGDLYQHEMPGGQYTNLFQQARALGLSDRWQEVCRTYALVNQALGDIVKVTPTSKAVGDLALMMVAGDVTVEDLTREDRDVAFPASVLDLLAGRMGQPPGGFPDAIRNKALKATTAVEGRPGATMPPADFDASGADFERQWGRRPNQRELVSSLLYPKVYEDYITHYQQFGDVSVLPTPVFFYGQRPGEEIRVDIEKGKTLIIKFVAMGDPTPDGARTVFFELNGQPREVSVADKSQTPSLPAARKADPTRPGHVAATMPGMVVSIAVSPGDEVRQGDKLLSLEAMKMETALHAEIDGTVDEVVVAPGSQVATGDLMLTLTPLS